MPQIKGLKWKIRDAKEEDIPIILDLCYQLSVYEKLDFKGTKEKYKKYGFSEEKIWNCILVENKGEIGPDYLGIALYYYTFSTFEAKPTLWLEDIFVPEKFRGNGIGTELFKKICKIAIEKDCGRIEWTVLDWNKPSRQFYINLGAVALDEWTIFRMLPQNFNKIAKS